MSGLEEIFSWAAIILGGISGGCWIKAAAIKTPLPLAYLSGPPKKVVDQIESQSFWNGIAAWFAAGAVLGQAASSIVHKISN